MLYFQTWKSLQAQHKTVKLRVAKATQLVATNFPIATIFSAMFVGLATSGIEDPLVGAAKFAAAAVVALQVLMAAFNYYDFLNCDEHDSALFHHAPKLDLFLFSLASIVWRVALVCTTFGVYFLSLPPPPSFSSSPFLPSFLPSFLHLTSPHLTPFLLF
jgi:hypothetical protein